MLPAGTSGVWGLAVSQSLGARGAHFRRGALIFCILGRNNPCRAALAGKRGINAQNFCGRLAVAYSLKPWNIQLLREFPQICALCMWPVYTRGLVRFFYAGQSSFLKCEVRTRLFIPFQGNPERPLLRENPGKFQKRAAPYLKRDSSAPLPQPDAPKTSGLSACKTGQAFAGYARGGGEDRSGKRSCRYRGFSPKV